MHQIYDLKNTLFDNPDTKTVRSIIKWLETSKRKWDGDSMNIINIINLHYLDEVYNMDIPSFEGNAWGSLKSDRIYPQSHGFIR